MKIIIINIFSWQVLLQNFVSGEYIGVVIQVSGLVVFNKCNFNQILEEEIVMEQLYLIWQVICFLYCIVGFKMNIVVFIIIDIG